MLKDFCKNGLLMGTLLASSSAEAIPFYIPDFSIEHVEPKTTSVKIGPEDRIESECDKVATDTFARILSLEMITGSQKHNAKGRAEQSRRDCIATEVAEYCATTGDMKYTEVINAFGFESELTVSKATQIADEAEKLCTDEMNVNLGIL